MGRQMRIIHAMSEASPPPPLNLSSDKAVATRHLQTFKLSILKGWCKERNIVVPKKPTPKKATNIKLLLTSYAQEEHISHEEEEDSIPPEDTSTIPSELENTTTATLLEFPDANISHLIFALQHHQPSNIPTAALTIAPPTQVKERNLYHPLLLVDAKTKIANLLDPTISVIADHSFNFTTNFKQTKSRLAHLCALLLACSSVAHC